ncbi:hypothetical protein COO60DRAFT_865645 [Scenedesmus sp. NREL 46B-D3]|nr:hypothetical protein COO60DRAFT_865645 [Scenedesmus sp. NREL 46B-D3]
MLGLSTGMPIKQEPQQHEQQQQQQQEYQQLLPQLFLQPQQQQQQQQLHPLQPLQHQQQQQHQLWPARNGAATLPAVGCAAQAEQPLQPAQQALPTPLAAVGFSSIGPAAAAAGAAAGAGHAVDKRSKPGGNAGRRSAQVSTAAAKTLTKSGDASRRYRERQRGLMASLEAELEGKLRQLQLLAAENEMLKLRSSVLEATVANREHAAQVTRQHGPPVYDSAHSRAPPEDPHHERLDSTDSGPPPQASPQAASAAAGSAPPAQRCLSLQKLHDLAEPASEVASAAAASAVPANSLDGGSHTVAAGPGAVGRRSPDGTAGAGADSPAARSKSCPELIKAMTSEDIVQHYRLFVRELGDELAAVQQETADGARAASHAAAAGAGAVAASPGPAAAAVEPEDSGGFSSLSEQRLQPSWAAAGTCSAWRQHSTQGRLVVWCLRGGGAGCSADSSS